MKSVLIISFSEVTMTFKIYSMSEIRGIPIGSLREFAKEIGVKGPTTMPKEALENAVYVRLKE